VTLAAILTVLDRRSMRVAPLFGFAAPMALGLDWDETHTG
jgi:hypothetical protein